MQIIKNTLVGVLACMQTQLQSFHTFVFNLCLCAEASNTCVNCTRWHWRRMRAVWVEARKCTGKIPNWPFGQTSWTTSVGQRRNSVWESCESSMYLSLLLACSWSRTQTGWATENPRLLCPHLYTDPTSNCCTGLAKMSSNKPQEKERLTVCLHCWCLVLKHNQSWSQCFPDVQTRIKDTFWW